MDVSSWTINSKIQHQLVILEIAPCEGSRYFPLPKELRNPMNGLINIQNEDNECFRWCLVRYLNKKNPEKIRNVDKEFAEQLNFKGIKFAVHKKGYAKAGKQNNISINIFRYKDETPYRIYNSKQSFEKYVDLLLLSNSKNSHYVLIKDFNRFMTNKSKYTRRQHFCRYCLQSMY